MGTVHLKKLKFWELKNYLERTYLRVKSNREAGEVGRSHITEGLEHWTATERF